MKKIIFIFLSSFLLTSSYAAYTLKEGKLIKKEEANLLSAQEHYSLILSSAEKKDWKEIGRLTRAAVKLTQE